MEAIMSDLDALYPDKVKQRLECQAKLFRSDYAASVCGGRGFIIELIKSLQHFSSFLSDQTMNDSNLLEQYQFCWLLRLTNNFMSALDRLKLTLTEVSNDEQLRSSLLEIVNTITLNFSLQSISDIKLEGEKYKSEITSIWKE